MTIDAVTPPMPPQDQEQAYLSGLYVDNVVVDVSDAQGTMRVLNGVSLSVEKGHIIGIVGPSGSGKSTLLRAVAGLEALRSGDVLWDGISVARTPVYRRGFGLMFQDGQLFPQRDVAGNVAYGLTGEAWRDRDARRARVSELLELVDLVGFEERDVTTLSGGERQRVALARSLAPQPRLLMLDEPLSALDRNLREHLTGEVRRVLQATSTTALYVTHDQTEVRTVADRVGILIDGVLAQIDDTEQLWKAPKTQEIAEFLGLEP